ncbi:MAG: cell surface protein SprA [Bacteroidia bacterium]|nr:cell surface protein SprA [Bacteroidia bacterium]MDW8056662.1 cell surface protein SprA [Bacteroidia bacterium]
MPLRLSLKSRVLILYAFGVVEWLKAQPGDTVRTRFRDSPADVTGRYIPSPPWMLPPPSNYEVVYELTPDGKGYWVYERIGGKTIRPPSYISREEYEKIQARRFTRQYLERRSREAQLSSTSNRPGTTPTTQSLSGLVPPININSELFRDIFGSGRVDIRPNINVLLDLSLRSNRMRNPALTIRQQRNTNLAFNQQIQLNVIGNIGEKLKLRLNWDTQTGFSFENQFKIEYQGYEDDIIKSIEAGNVGLPLGGTLITGGQNLWGIKTRMQFGSVFVTALASQQRSKSQEVVVRAGGQRQERVKKASDYDFNRHFFLNHFFRSLYEQSLSTLPVVSSPINITRIEVWVTNRANAVAQNTRNAVGLVDLGENLPSRGGRLFNPGIAVSGQNPDNNANEVYARVLRHPGARSRDSVVFYLSQEGLVNGQDFELVENMRRLNENEYFVHRQLGYISLNISLQPNDAVFVAYEYTLAGDNTVYRVGEFSIDQPADPQNSNVLFLKMLKPQAIRPTLNNQPYPTWDLMMKNVYRLDAFNIRPEGFDLQIVYEATDGSGDILYLPSADTREKPLLQVVGLDRLRNNMEAGPDNVFDFIPQVTVFPDRGIIVFPVLEPFGRHLVRQFVTDPVNDSIKYAYDPLYRLTQVDAVQYYPQLNRFKLKYSFLASTGAEINLNTPQIQPGSIRVTAGGAPLTEGVDYQVDYTIGKVTILNQGILQSGQEIRVRFESNVLFGIDQKTLVGGRVEWRPSQRFQLGATGLSFYERPLINKVIISEEPAANIMWGIDANLQERSRFLSALLNSLPFYSTKEESEITFKGEFAQLRPGIPRQVVTGGERGIAYIDDFEGLRNVLDLTQWTQWKLASTPPSLRPSDPNPLSANFTRAALSWYFIDPEFYNRPSTFGLNDQSPALNSHYTRRVEPAEIFPNRTIAAGSNILTTFDLYYRPQERGPYNYNANPNALNPDGTFRNPQTNWAGIMRRVIGNTDFEAANYEFIEFWLMDPFLDNPSAQGGDLYFNLGQMSEDVLPDNRRAYEHGLPTRAEDDAANLNLTLTPWGRVPNIQIPTLAFDNDPNARQFQDVGLDGLRSEAERNFFSSYLSQLQNVLSPEAYQQVLNDPSSDDYAHFRDISSPSILERYKRFSGLEGNSPIPRPNEPFTRQASALPDVEDINLDGTLNTQEAFYSYRVSLRPQDLVVGRNYIVDKRELEVKLPNGSTVTTRWYLFRIPLSAGTPVGGIQNFKAIDFIRMYLTNFDREVVLRFGKLELVSTMWRRALINLNQRDETLLPDPAGDPTKFETGTMNIEENGSRQPFPYVLPPNILRQPIPGSPIAGLLQNEQSLVMRVCNLADGDGRGVFRTFNYDLRFYERLRLWAHAEPLVGSPIPPNVSQLGDVTLFIRIGTDYSDNYYEYEVPLQLSQPGNLSVENIWANNIDIRLEDLNFVKVLRDEARQRQNFPINQVFTYTLPNGSRISVKGTPQLNNVKTILIGIRNPDDGRGPICVEVWVNELRVTNYNTRPGWSTSGVLNVRLADLGNLSVSGSMSTPWFGSIEQKVGQRSTEWQQRYTLTGGLQLHRLLPQKAGLEIPAFFTYGESFTRPLYSPYDPDVLTRTRLEAQSNLSQRDSLERILTSYSRTYSYTFAGVRKTYVNPQAKKRFWHLQNFLFSYGYNETYTRNPQTEYLFNRQYTGSIAYNYNFQSKPFKPFGKLKPALLRDFSISYLPAQVGWRVEGNRQYQEQKLRPIGGGPQVRPTFYQNFLLNRQYVLQWNLTPSLNLNYNATVQARVDEPEGPINTPEKRDSLWNNFLSFGKDPARGKFHRINFGRTLNFQQNITATYRLPLNKIKWTDWINSSVTYTADYRWMTAALGQERFGNTISNSRNIQVTGQFQLSSLYKKVKFIDKLLTPPPKRNIFSQADTSRKQGDDPYIAARQIGRVIGKIIFGIQNVDVTYSRQQGTTLPGFLPRPANFGLDWDYTDSVTGVRSQAPGWGFILGEQPDLQGGWLQTNARKGWFTRDPRFTLPFQQTRSTQLNVRAGITPVKDLRIDLTLTRNESFTRGGLFGWDTLQQDFAFSNPSAQGSFSMSFLGARLLALGQRDRSYERLEGEYRYIFSTRLRLSNPFYESVLGPNAVLTRRDYWNGYTGSQQDVLTLAFLSAYGPYNPNRMSLSPFPSIPLPNWNVSYTGLSQIPFFKERFRTVTLNHAYRGTYTASYVLNLRAADRNRDGFSESIQPIQSPLDTLPGLTVYNFEPVFVINAVSIQESFSPLVGFNIAWKNGMNTTIELRRSRTTTLNVGALQLNQNKNTEFSFTWNWRRESFLQPFSLFGRTFELKNSATFRIEITYRSLINQNRQIDNPIFTQPIGGTRSFTIKPAVDYSISTQLTVRAYIEHTRNRPVLSNSFPTSFTAVGVQFRFSLTN